MKVSVKEILKPAFILGMVCLISAAALAGVNLLTEDKIATMQLEIAEKSRKIALIEAETFEEAEGCFVGMSGGEVVGYVFETEAKGYSGTIRVMTGIKESGIISGVAILSQSETPGLGANAQKEAFREQYQQDISQGGFEVVKNQAAGNGTVEAMTGATITSNAVTVAVNKAAEQYRLMKGDS